MKELVLGERACQGEHFGVRRFELGQHVGTTPVLPLPIDPIVQKGSLGPVQVVGGRAGVAAVEALGVPGEKHLLPFDQVRDDVFHQPFMAHAWDLEVNGRESVDAPAQQTVLGLDGIEEFLLGLGDRHPGDWEGSE